MSNLKRHKLFFVIISVIFFLFFSCDDNTPIPQDKFLKVYVDLLIIQDTTNAEIFSLDSIKAVVFQKYNIRSGQYDSTIEYYNSDPNRWIEFFDSAGAYVERLKSNAGNQL